jgi:Tfp pilus assembly PilM family ATPase/MFS family permease
MRFLQTIKTDLKALRITNLRLYWVGRLFSLTGSWAQALALVWLVFELTGSSFQVGLVIALQLAPVLMLRPFGGVHSLRRDRRRILSATQFCMAMQAFVLFFLTLVELIQPSHIMALAALLGIVNAIESPIRKDFLRQMSGDRDFKSAIALERFAFRFSGVIGPIIGGLLISSLGIASVFLINAMTFFAVLTVLSVIREQDLYELSPDASRNGWTEAKAGFRNLREAVPQRQAVAVNCVIATFGMGLCVLIPEMARDALMIGASGFGVLTAALGLGFFLGGAFMILVPRPADLRIVLLSAVGFVVLAALLVLTYGKASFSVSALILLGVGFVAFTTASGTRNSLSESAPKELSRAVEFFHGTANYGFLILGSLIAGIAARFIGIPTTLWIGAGIAALAAFLFWWKMNRHRLSAKPFRAAASSVSGLSRSVVNSKVSTGLRSAVGTGASTLGSWARKGASGFGTAAGRGASGLWSGAKKGASGLRTVVGRGASGLGSGAKKGASGLRSAVGTGAPALWSAMSSGASSVASVAGSGVSGLLKQPARVRGAICSLRSSRVRDADQQVGSGLDEGQDSAGQVPDAIQLASPQHEELDMPSETPVADRQQPHETDAAPPPEIDTTPLPEIDTPPRPEIDTTPPPEVDTPLPPEIDTTPPPEIDRPPRPEIDTPLPEIKKPERKPRKPIRRPLLDLTRPWRAFTSRVSSLVRGFAGIHISTPSLKRKKVRTAKRHEKPGTRKVRGRHRRALLWKARDARTGIDLGANSIKLVRCVGSAGLRFITHAGIEDWESTETGEDKILAASALDRLLSRLGLRKRHLGRVAVGVGGENVAISEVLLPPLTEGELRKALPFEAKRHLFLDRLDNPMLDFQIMGPVQTEEGNDSPEMRVVLAAVSGSYRTSILETLARVGLEPEVIDLESLAGLNALLTHVPFDRGDDHAVGLLDLGAKQASLHLTHPGGGLLTRLVAPGVPRGNSGVVDHYVKGLVSSIQETLTYYRARQRRVVESLFLAGGGALQSKITEKIQESLSIPVEIFDPLKDGVSSAECEETVAACGPRLVTAYGLTRWWDTPAAERGRP